MGKLFQIAFWAASGILLTFVFSQPNGGLAQSLYFVAFLLPVIIGTSYFFNYWLLPKYLFKGRYWKFALYLFYCMVVSVYLEMLVLTGALVLLANSEFKQLNSKTTDVVLLSIVLYFFVFANTIIVLVNEHFKGQRKLKILDDEVAKSDVGCITVRSDRRNVNVPFDQIVYIESFNDYVTIHLKVGNALVTKEKISILHVKLPSFFIRIHRSFIVNRHQVLSHNKECVCIGERELPLGRKYKVDAVKSLIGNG